MRRALSTGGLALVLICLLQAALATSARAEEPWEVEVRKQEAAQDVELQEARQHGTTRNIVQKYASRISRQPTALNHYLLARAYYYDGDVDGAKRQLDTVLRLQPSFWFARLRLAMLALQSRQLPLAEKLVREVMRTKPREPDALKLYVQLRMEAKDWDGALRASEDLLTLDPGDEAVRRNIAFILMAKKDWPRAMKELRILLGRKPNDPAIRWYFASTLFEMGKLKEAAKEFELLLRMAPDDLRALDMLRFIYAKLEDGKSYEKTLERMLKLLEQTLAKNGSMPAEQAAKLREVKAKVEEALKGLHSGAATAPPPPPDGESWPENLWLRLIEKAMDMSDVEGRRAALQQYYEARFPRMPHALVGRIHPDHEPDATCRQWLLRIMGQMQNPQLAQVTAYALYDPDSGVREKAADALGEIATPSGVLYLMPMLLGARLEGEPPQKQVVEVNAARRGLIAITGRLDPYGGIESWVEAKDLAAMQKNWLAWLQSPEGVHARLKAIHDLETQGDLRPELHLLEDVSDPEVEIAKAAYKVLLNRSKLPSEDKVAAAMWPRFPVFPEPQLTEEGMGAVRAAVKQWWEDWRAMRQKLTKGRQGS